MALSAAFPAKETSTTGTLDRSRQQKLAIAAWILQSILALVFAAAAGAKLAGVPMMVMIFDQVGLGQWFRYVTAAVEVIGAVALVIPGFAGPGALWLGITMGFAILTHVLILHANPLGAIVLLLLSVTLVWPRSNQFAAQRTRFA